MRPILKRGLFECQALSLPGLVKTLFPDSLFPVPFKHLQNRIVAASHGVWQFSEKYKTWDLYQDIVLSSVVSGRPFMPGKGEDALVDWLNKIGDSSMEIFKTYNTSLTSLPAREWVHDYSVGGHEVPTKSKRVHLVEKGKYETWSAVLATAGMHTNWSTKDLSRVPNHLTDSADMVFSSQLESGSSRPHIGVWFSHTNVTVFNFTRSGVVSSQQFDIKNNVALLVRLVCGLMLINHDTNPVESADLPSVPVLLTVQGRAEAIEKPAGGSKRKLSPLHEGSSDGQKENVKPAAPRKRRRVIPAPQDSSIDPRRSSRIQGRTATMKTGTKT